MSPAVASPYRYSQTIGMFVEVGRGMSNPYDVAPAGDGRLFVLSRSNIFDAPVGGLRIGIVTLDEDYLGEWGSYGTGPGQLVWPNSMVLDVHGRLLISDEWRHDVQCFDQDGTLLHSWGGPGTADGRFNRTAGLAFDSTGHVVVVVVKRQSAADPEAEKRFWGAVSVRVDSTGRLYVAEHSRHRIQLYERVQTPYLKYTFSTCVR